MDLQNPDQAVYLNVGRSGCYFLCLLYAAGALPYILDVYKEAVANGYMTRECYIADPQGLCDVIEKWSGTALCYVGYSGTRSAQPDEIIIAKYVRGSDTHFVVVGHGGELLYDPYGRSATRLYGKLDSYRIYARRN